MASNAAEEQQYIDGTHPALAGNAPVRSTSPVRSRSVSPVSSSSRSSSPRFKTVDSDPPSSNNTPMPALNPPTRNGGASNTGPKGVLADFKASRTGGASNTGPKGVLADWKGNEASKAGRGTLHSAVRGVRVISLDDNEDGEASGEGNQSGGRTAAGEEGEAIERYRRKRMQELSGSGERSGKGKMFGHLREIGVDQFLSAIDDEHPDVAVVLHLYEPVSSSIHPLYFLYETDIYAVAHRSLCHSRSSPVFDSSRIPPH